MSSPHEPDATAERAARGPFARRRHPLALGAIAGVALSIVGALIVLGIIAFVRRAPQLTRAEYEAAAARWDAHGPASYNLDVELEGKRASRIHVEVREGEVTHMTRDGVQPRQRRTWYYWSVPGQLDTIEQELDMAEDPAGSYGVPGAPQVAMWARFDPKYGYPLEFLRVVLSADLEVHWRVTRFEVVDEKNPGPAAGVGVAP